MNNLTLQLKELEKEKTKPEVYRRKEITNKIETEKTIKKATQLRTGISEGSTSL